MPWTRFYQELDRFQARYVALRQIAVIVTLHPEWQDQEPSLTRLLREVEENRSTATLDELIADCREE